MKRVPCAEALQRAKRNVELYYAAVGVVDDFKGFLSVLEVLLPIYFANSVRVYEQRGKHFHVVCILCVSRALHGATTRSNIVMSMGKMLYQPPFFPFL